MDRSSRKLVAFAQRNPTAAAVVNSFGRSRARRLLNHFHDWLPPGGRILDIGAGTGHMAEAILAAGHEVVLLDVCDQRFVDIPLVLANGTHLPFADSSFDAALLITVLHHLPLALHPEMLKEGVRALRPNGRLLIVEDTYIDKIDRALTFLMDSVLNAEYCGHPHANRSLAEWKELMRLLDMRLIHASEFTEWYGVFRFRHAEIVIERPSDGQNGQDGRGRPK